MGRIALYRKYRSRALNEVVGQDHITSVLEAAVKNGNFSHAYLLTGQRGIGKTSVARILAHLINDLAYTDDERLDIIEIDGASNRGIDDIRALRDKITIAPSESKYKVYIIDEVHMLTKEAFNALLKSLEEPPEHVVFILATTEVQKVPATILSRTQRFHFRPVEVAKVADHLRFIADKEKIKIDNDALKLIAERGEGSFRDAISLLDQLSGFDKSVSVADVENILGIAPLGKIKELVKGIISKDSTGVVKVLAKLESEGISPNIIVEQLIKRLLAEATNQHSLYELVEKLIDVPKSYNAQLKLLAVLSGYAASGAKPKVMPLSVAPPKAVVVKEKVAKVEPAERVSEPEVEYQHKQTNAPLEIDWDKIVAEAKKLNAPCGSLISNASIDYDGENLTLYFRQKIYRTKMNEARCRTVLNNALINLYETPPKIIISDGPKPKSATLSKVADIMGGGEAV